KMTNARIAIETSARRILIARSMHELYWSVEILVQANRQRGEDCVTVPVGVAVESLVDMFEAALHGNPMAGEQRHLRRAAGEPFQRGEAVRRRELADRVHSGIEVHRGETATALADLGDAQADLVPHLRERIGGHACSSCRTEGRAIALTGRYGPVSVDIL